MKKHIFLIIIICSTISSSLLFAQTTPATIIKEGNYIVSPSDGTINLKATDYIILKPNTWIKPGSDFHVTLLNGSTEYLAPELSNKNYLFSQNLQVPITDINQISNPSDVLETISYFDEFGRPVQEIASGQAFNNKDIITHIAYDSCGRKNKQYLPFVPPSLGGKGSYRTHNLDQNTKDYYTSYHSSDFTSIIKNPYTEKKYDLSPLNKVLKQGHPGAAWEVNNHPIKFDYGTNTATEVRKYNVSLNNLRVPTLNLDSGSTGYYAVGKLYKTTTYNENHVSGFDGVLEKFEDRDNNIILERTYLNGEKYDTHYVYDLFGNLTYVLPPQSEAHVAKPNSTSLNELCYKYTYDKRNRLIEKKLPGKMEEFIVYDLLNRPVLVQSGNQRELAPTKEWTFTKFDDHGREIYSGLFKSNDSREAIQSLFDNKAGNGARNYEVKVSSGTGYNGTYYTNSDYPNNNLEILTVNYYDNYYFNKDGGQSAISSYGINSITAPQNLPTGSRIKVLGTTDWITNVNYYTKKGRLIYVYAKNEHLQATNLIANKLDFIGRINKTKTTHKKTGHPDLILENAFIYDHVGRLLEQTQIINNQSSLKEILVSNSYNELGELQSKGVGGKTGQNRLQIVNYTYNVRGWLKSINQDIHNDNDLFNFSLSYNNPTISNTTALFNGNISETHWQTSTDNLPKNYQYSYDPLDRITAGIDNTADQRYSLTNIEYDKNGNITKLKRNGHLVDMPNDVNDFGVMDDMTYSYTGNRLKAIDDDIAASASQGFVEGVKQVTEYTYDSNGNMTSDANKGINTITYNHLNLPKQITFNTGNVKYTYAADGTKIKRVVSTGAVTEYLGSFVYAGNSNTTNLQFFNQNEGYVFPNGGGYSYAYHYKDHLDNIRLSYVDANGDGFIDPSNEIIKKVNYYPFGLDHREYNNITSSYGNSLAKQWKLGSKEYDESLGLLNTYDFGARNYDPTLARWSNIDNLAEEYRSFSPYNYVLNNPVLMIDPDGNMPIQSVEKAAAPMWNSFFRRQSYIRSYTQGRPYWENGFGNEAQRQAAINNPGDYGAQMRALPDGSIVKQMYQKTMGYVSTQSGSSNYTPGIDGMQVLGMVTGTQDLTDGTLALIDGDYGSAAKHYAYFGAGAILRGGPGLLSKIGKAARGSTSAARLFSNGTKLNQHLTQLEKFGSGGFKTLQNGHFRYYSKATLNRGNANSFRTVREWNPATGTKRTWFETLNPNGGVIQVRPEFGTGVKTHYLFNGSGGYLGKW